MTSKAKADERLPKRARLAKRKDIVHLQRAGKKIHTKSFIIALRPNLIGESRLAITVSKKVDKRAVVRNKVKRRLRELFRKNRLNLVKPYDVVVIARSSASECSFEECSRQIIGALRFHKLLAPPVTTTMTKKPR